MFYKLLLLCAVAHAESGWWSVRQSCKNNSQCAKNKCCLNNKCSNLGNRYAECNPVVYIRQPDVYTDYCPCSPGLFCHNNLDSKGLGTCRGTCKSDSGCLSDEHCVNGVCFRKSEENCPKTCKTSKECGPNECCRTPSNLKGRKKRQIGGVSGTCTPIGQAGAKCVYHGPQGPSNTFMFYECPCQKGLDCVNSAGGLTVPITFGTCTPKRQCAKGADCRVGECCHFPKGRDSGGVCESNSATLKGVCEAACVSGSDCKPGECCLSATQPRGRRKRDSYIQATGSCTSFGSQGAECLANAIAPGDGTMYRCPCQKGLSCQNGVPSNPLLIGSCEPMNSVKYCSSGADCPADQCCVSTIQPVGRKKRRTPIPPGTCGPMRQSGDKCNPNQSVSGKPKGIVISCPCVSGLQCVDQSTGTIVLPNFETGVCSAKRRG